MIRFVSVALLTALAGALLLLALLWMWVWWIPAAVVAVIAAVGVYDLVQRQHSVLRNYPIVGHMRFLLEALRPRYSSTSSSGTSTDAPSTATFDR